MIPCSLRTASAAPQPHTRQILLLIGSLQAEDFTNSSLAKHCVEDCHI